MPAWWRPLCRWQFAVLLAIYTYMGLTSATGPHMPEYNDKLMHYLGYLVAGGSITFALPHWHWGRRALLLLVYSAAIECVQHFLPTRSFSLADMLANTLGVATGLTLIEVARIWAPRLSRQLLND